MLVGISENKIRVFSLYDIHHSVFVLTTNYAPAPSGLPAVTLLSTQNHAYVPVPKSEMNIALGFYVGLVLCCDKDVK